MSLEVIGLRRNYGDFSLSLELHVASGETLALVGPSGSGKTTALNLIAGLAAPEEGKVLIGGEDLSALPSWKRNISIVFQDLALFPHLDVGGNISYGLFIRRVPRKERTRIIEETLKIVRLSGYAGRRINSLSGGERQRVAIARALASSPRALLLDEPFSSLDAPLRKEMRVQFLEIRSHSNAPCVFVTHDREEAVMLGDKIALLSEGRVVESGSGHDLFLSPKTEFAARFFGAGQVLPCLIQDKRSGGTEVNCPLGLLTVPDGFPAANTATNERAPNPLVFVPHDALSLGKKDRAGWKSFQVRFLSAVFEGQSVRAKILSREVFPGENYQKTHSEFPLEIIAGARFKQPLPGSIIDLWVDQSLLRFVEANPNLSGRTL